MRTALRRHAATAALAMSMLAVVLSVTGAADAAKRSIVDVVTKPKPRAVLRLDAKARFPASAIPKVRAAREADTVGGRTPDELVGKCNAESVDLGTWCLLAVPYAVPNSDIGKNNYAYAGAKCTELGGYLPTAAQLLGAVKEVKLAGTIDDNRLTASIDEDATDGLKDRREMTATLITTQAGSSAPARRACPRARAATRRPASPTPCPSRRARRRSRCST
jgi:hypothetical protein